MASPTTKLDCRRRSARTAAVIPVTWHAQLSAHRVGAIVDASCDGVFIALDLDDANPPALGESVCLEVFVDGEGYSLEGIVRWTGTHTISETVGFGLMFDPSSAYIAEALAFRLSDDAHSVSGTYPRVFG